MTLRFFPKLVSTILFAAGLLASVALAADQQEIEADAMVIPFRQVSVSFPVGGIVEEIDVREGARVERGDLLATLEHEEELLDALRYEKMLEKRRSDHEATDQLFRENMTSEEEALEKRIEMEVADIDRRRALAAVEQKKLHAPLSGLVVDRLREPGEWVDPGAVVLEIVEIDQVYARLMLTAEESRSIRIDQEISLSFPALSKEERFVGKVDFIDPRIDASSGLLAVRVLVDNPNHRLRPGLSGFAHLSL